MRCRVLRQLPPHPLFRHLIQSQGFTGLWLAPLLSSSHLSPSSRLLHLLTLPMWMAKRNPDLTYPESGCGFLSPCLLLLPSPPFPEWECHSMCLDSDPNLWSHARPCLSRASSPPDDPVCSTFQLSPDPSRFLPPHSCFPVPRRYYLSPGSPQRLPAGFSASRFARSLLFPKMAARMVISARKLDPVSPLLTSPGPSHLTSE